ncbi:DUF2569 domain-containing protein [Pseudophaeobacter sp.]|uniref:DUF2569 domain-containing protein n=1 Tax=Pseudophaeobacter sp. TaxID=1971739 RepID=UPI00329A5372
MDSENLAPEPQKFGGWLILVGIGVVVTPFSFLISLVPLYRTLFQEGAWQLLASPSSDFYNPLLSSILVGEMVINACLLLASVMILVKFFAKSRLFPKLYIAMAILTLCFIVADAAAVKMVVPEEPMFDEQTVKELVRSLVVVLIWCPYMLISERVKATFTL